VIPLKPVRCSPCERSWLGADPNLYRHQVAEFPPVKAVVAEHHLHSLVCPGYGGATRAELPAGIPTGGFPLRVQAITALCTGAYHLSNRTTQAVMADLFGVVMGLGRVAHLELGMVQVVVNPVAVRLYDDRL
jgi:transposase